ncbi:branched-chain amino acid ABC transporter ATP-binding protein/permease [Sinosporangium siamense]|uniref:Metal-dependent hydrolase n=1 Tax=Sinosporangium siamense TaxID=1367973 RepID=A0A919RFA1_9ACTN|nr:branched-chain amino acid ABC transporter ATP-binding protein/permease [Sinosporangium siamense]GII92818.1 metal-dependent hydrolase [Sinosporangium siamense]
MRLSPYTVAIGVVAAVITFFPALTDNLYYQNMVILSLVFAISAAGLNVITGYTGYISLGQGAFLGIGAYVCAILSQHVDVSPFVWVPLAGVVAAAVAMLLGLVTFRSRGPSFVIITIAFLFLVQFVATNWTSLTNGSAGITMPLPDWDPALGNWPFHLALVVLLALSLVMSWWIRRTKFGMGLIAIREDEDKAGTIGVNAPVYKLLAFGASALFVGMAGAVYGYYLTFVDPIGMFTILVSVQIVLSLILGGRGTLFGPVLGAFIIEPVNAVANNEFGGGNVRLLLFGALLVLLVLLLPRGILPTVAGLPARRRTRGTAGLTGARLEIAERPPPPAAPAPSGKVLLEVKGLAKSFGGLRAVDGCSFTVPEGSITGLIGPNGSGKTTVFNLIGGSMEGDGGEIWLDGRRIDRLPPWSRAHLGLGRTFQTTRLFNEMTALENVVAPLRDFSFGQLRLDGVSGAEAAKAQELLDFVGMGAYRDHPAGQLSYGQQKLVELAQILVLDPRLILLDEPAGGINPTLIERMGSLIRELNADGKTFLLVEHNMPFVLGLCDPIRVLAQGRCLAEGTPQEIQRDPRVVEAYLGDDYLLESTNGGR